LNSWRSTRVVIKRDIAFSVEYTSIYYNV
jgi:hypothetical protein